MKRPLFYLAIFLLAVTATSSFAQNKKVAVVTFYAVKKLGVGQFGSVAQLVNRLADDPNFNMQPLLNNFHTQFFDTYSKDLPFTLLPENEVLNNEAYKAYVPVGEEGTGVLKDTYNLPYPGYKVILPLAGHTNEKNLLKMFPQADGVMKVYVDFDLVQVGFAGMGVVKVNAFANIALFDKNGEKIFSSRRTLVRWWAVYR
jgi:hypothetical protein